jgi:hypothetical protein
MVTSFSGGRSRSNNLERTTDHGQATGKLYHLRLQVQCTLFCNLQSGSWTHAVLVISLYELLGQYLAIKFQRMSDYCFNAKWATVSAIPWQEQVTFPLNDDNDVRLVLAHLNKSLHIDITPHGHVILILANQFAHSP